MPEPGISIAQEEIESKHLWASTLAVVCYFAAAKLLIHFLFNGGYGYFRDELYFLACGAHLDWGYVDHAPMIGLAAKVSRAVLGDSLFAIRFLSAVAGALKVLLTGLMVREFKGGRFAVTLACLCVLAAPGYLTIDNMLSMNAYEPVFWMGGVYFAILAVNRGDPRYWLGFGAAAGLGLQNKHSTLFFGLAMLIGVIATRQRRLLLDKWLWVAGALAFIIFLPNIIWEYSHGWATLELLNNVKTTGKNVSVSPLAFIAQQLLIMSPFTAPVWLAGIWFFLFDSKGKRYRMLGVAYLVLLALMILMEGKSYYLIPIYPMLLAGGAVFWERYIEKRPAVRWLNLAYPLLLVLGGAALSPYSMPVLPVERFLTYQQWLGFEPPKTEVGHAGKLPQHLGDMFGWPEMVEAVSRVYNNLPPEERAKAAIYTGNYGEAGAIDFFGPRYGLPAAISGHQSYYLWGPREYTGEVMIILQANRADAEKRFKSVEEAEVVGHPYAMAEEHFTILVGRGLKEPLPELWPRLKHWN